MIFYMNRQDIWEDTCKNTFNFIVRRVGQFLQISFSSTMSILSVIIFPTQDFWSLWMIFITWAAAWSCSRLQTTSSTKSCTTLSSPSRCLPGSAFVWPTWWLMEERNGPRSLLNITQVLPRTTPRRVFSSSVIICFQH